jgi:hypothetical protein
VKRLSAMSQVSARACKVLVFVALRRDSSGAQDDEGCRFWVSLKAGSYLRNNHIAHPATNTPPMNIAKQYKP